MRRERPDRKHMLRQLFHKGNHEPLSYRNLKVALITEGIPHREAKLIPRDIKEGRYSEFTHARRGNRVLYYEKSFENRLPKGFAPIRYPEHKQPKKHTSTKYHTRRLKAILGSWEDEIEHAGVDPFGLYKWETASKKGMTPRRTVVLLGAESYPRESENEYETPWETDERISERELPIERETLFRDLKNHLVFKPDIPARWEGLKRRIGLMREKLEELLSICERVLMCDLDRWQNESAKGANRLWGNHAKSRPEDFELRPPGWPPVNIHFLAHTALTLSGARFRVPHDFLTHAPREYFLELAKHSDIVASAAELVDLCSRCREELDYIRAGIAENLEVEVFPGRCRFVE